VNANAKLWVAALRSGKYPQGRNCLSDGINLCCLGVACEVAIENGTPVTKKPSPTGQYVFYDGSIGILPDSVRDWLGLTTRSGQYLAKDGKYADLTVGNDDLRLTFSEIADIIESEPPGLFAEQQ
jgi:hypothetical protein